MRTATPSRLECLQCGAWTTSNVYALPPEGNDAAEIMLVGEGAGQDEELYGRNFIGRAGDMLNHCLAAAGILRAETFIANIVRCRCITPIGRNRKPTAAEIGHCREFTIDDAQRVKPKVIVALGDSAMVGILGKMTGGVTENRGKVRWAEEFGAWVVVTFHPAFALRQPPQAEFIIDDLRLALRIVETGQPPESAPVFIRVVETRDDLYEMREDILRHAERLAYDTETNGVHPIRSRAFAYGFSYGDRRAWVVQRYRQLWTPAWTRDELAEVDQVLREILTSDIPKDGWVLPFDNNITLSTLGVEVRGEMFCGQTAHHAVANHLGEASHGLKIFSARHTDLGRYDDELDQWLRDNGFVYRNRPDHGAIWQAPDELVHKYLGLDAIATNLAPPILIPWMQQEGVYDLFVNERMPLVLEHAKMDRRGLRINVPYLDEISGKLADALVQIEDDLKALAGKPVNPASPKQVADYLFDQEDLPILGRTDTGLPATGEEFLVQLRDLHPAIPLIMRHRTFAKIKATWIDGRNTTHGQRKALRAALDDDGRARMATKCNALVTYRFASNVPFAYHTFPRNDPAYPSVRALVIADEDEDFECRDFMQQEFAVQALAAGQDDVVDAMLNRGEDVHELVTRELGGISKDAYLSPYTIADLVQVGDRRLPILDALALGDAAPILSTGERASVLHYDGETPQLWKSREAFYTYKNARVKWKSVNFMVLFRGGAPKLARMALGCRCVRGRDLCEHQAEASQYISLYGERYSAIRMWQYRKIKEAERTGRVVGLFGAYRIVPGIFSSDRMLRAEAERQLCNFPVQEGGARAMIRALLGAQAEFKRKKFPGRIEFTVHDELIAGIRRDVFDDGAHIVRRHMEASRPEFNGWSLRTSGQRVSRWGG